MSDKFNLDRQMNVDNNIDALGKKWEIVHIKGSALYEGRCNPYDERVATPKEFEGRWTKPTLLDKQIKVYVNRTWDMAEEAAKKAPGKERAKKQREEEASVTEE